MQVTESHLAQAKGGLIVRPGGPSCKAGGWVQSTRTLSCGMGCPVAPPPSGRHSLSPGSQHHCPGRLCPSPCGQRPCWGWGTGCGLCWRLAPSLGASGTRTPRRSAVWPQLLPSDKPQGFLGAWSSARASPQREQRRGSSAEGGHLWKPLGPIHSARIQQHGGSGGTGVGFPGEPGLWWGQGGRTPAPPQSGA